MSDAQKIFKISKMKFSNETQMVTSLHTSLMIDQSDTRCCNAWSIFSFVSLLMGFGKKIFPPSHFHVPHEIGIEIFNGKPARHISCHSTHFSRSFRAIFE